MKRTKVHITKRKSEVNKKEKRNRNKLRRKKRKEKKSDLRIADAHLEELGGRGWAVGPGGEGAGVDGGRGGDAQEGAEVPEEAALDLDQLLGRHLVRLVQQDACLERSLG